MSFAGDAQGYGDDWEQVGFGLYLHWPFCQSKCPYCDFNSHVAAKIDQDQWAQAYLQEIERVAALTPGRRLSTIYFGGGTPSLMPPSTVEAIIDRAQRVWRLSNNVEITLEANPTSVEAERLRSFRAAGINRVSLGVQALEDEALRRLGRMHDSAEALKALDAAATIFDRYSFDLIYARQYQTLAQWEQELRRALSFGSSHMSLYQLTVEDGTVFGQRHQAGHLKGLPSEDLGADFYDMTQEICESHGLPAYEISNHAREGQESRHNLLYWQSGDFAGIGPGAHGRLTLNGQRHATAALREPAKWLSQARHGKIQDIDAVLSVSEVQTEFLLMGLRLREGISSQRFHALAGFDLPAAKLAYLIDLGMLEREGDKIRATAKGRPILNSVLLELVSDL